MKRIITRSLIIGAIFSMSPLAHAGKVEDVQAAVKKDCGKDVDSAAALRMVKPLFVDCTSGQKTSVDGACNMACLKSNDGAVVGK